MRFALVVLASCSWSQHSHWRTECPPGSSELRVGDVQYCLISCHGALEDTVYYTGTDSVGVFDDGRVVVVQRHDANGSSIDTPRGVPDAVCRWLPHGCRCTTPACKYATPSTTADQDGNPIVRPRCEASDPDCGPETFRGVCPAAVGYEPGVGRYPLVSDPLTPGHACTYDGECINSGCGYQCSSIATIEKRIADQIVFTCEARVGLEEIYNRALCGCVQGNCVWFEVARR